MVFSYSSPNWRSPAPSLPLRSSNLIYIQESPTTLHMLSSPTSISWKGFLLKLQAQTSNNSMDISALTAQRHLKLHVSKPNALTSSSKFFLLQHYLSRRTKPSPIQSLKSETKSHMYSPLLSHQVDSSFIHSKAFTEHVLQARHAAKCWGLQYTVATFTRLNQSLSLAESVYDLFCISTPSSVCHCASSALVTSPLVTALGPFHHHLLPAHLPSIYLQAAAWMILLTWRIQPGSSFAQHPSRVPVASLPDKI